MKNYIKTDSGELAEVRTVDIESLKAELDACTGQIAEITRQKEVGAAEYDRLIAIQQSRIDEINSIIDQGVSLNVDAAVIAKGKIETPIDITPMETPITL